MANFGDLVGAFMQSTMAPSGNNRIGSALEGLQQSGFGGQGGQGGQGGMAQGQAGGAGGGLFGSVLDMVKGGLSSASQNPAQAGGLGALVGSLLGGGGSSVKGAVGGGVMAMLASVAMQALQNSGRQQEPAGGGMPWSGGNMPLGLKAAETPEEEQTVENTAQLLLKGMINAAKSDGEIGPKEMERIVGKLQETGADEDAKQWVMNEMRQPLNLDAFASEIPNLEVAIQVYAASLLAVEVDTDAERNYLHQLADKTGIPSEVVEQINKTLGVTV